MWWWRKVRNHTYWLPGSSPHPEGLPYYVHDVSLRRLNNEQGLSLYATADSSEAEKVTHYFALTQMGYDNLDYLLIPDGTWEILELRPELVCCTGLPPYLSDRHYEVRGLTETLEARLADIILKDASRQACRAKKGNVRQVAPTYLNADSALRQFLHEEWEAELFGC
jgi:hypothetical protein